MSDGNDDDGSYDVGKGKPPKEHQFQPGKSGNPRGRPRKRKSILVPREVDRIILRLLDETVEVTKSSRKYKVTKFEYLMMQKVNQAMKGSRLHQNDTLKLALKAMDARVTIHKDVAWADCLQDMAMDCPESINPDILNEYLKNTKGKY